MMKRFFKIVRWIAVLLWGGLGVICLANNQLVLGLFWLVFATFALVLEILNSKPAGR